MKPKNREKWFLNAVSVLLGIVCALALGAVFYGAMAYQLAGDSTQDAQGAPMAGEHALLALADAQLLSEQTVHQEMSGVLCTVITRAYRTQDGLDAEVVCASPAAYIERLAAEEWTAQLTTGFVLAGMDAVYSIRDGEGMLSARDGDRVYMLRCAADEQVLYALGANALLE